MQYSKIATLVILILFPYGALHAQTSGHTHYGLEKSVIARWEILEMKANKDPSGSLQSIRDAIKKIPAANNRERVYAEQMLISLKLTLEMSPEALADIEQLEDDILLLSEPLYTSKMLSQKARAYNNMGQYIKALELANRALVLLEPLGNKVEIGKVRQERGLIRYSQSHFFEALDDYLYAYKVFKEHNQTVRLGMVVAAIAEVYSKTGQHLESIDFYKKALKIVDENNQQLFKSIILFNIGLANFRVEDYTSASSFFTEALNLSLELNDEVGQAYAWHQLGKISQIQEKNKVAISYYQKAYSILMNNKDRKMLVNVSLSLASIQVAVGEFEQAVVHLSKALQVAKEFKQVDSLIWSHRTAAYVYEQSNQLRKALEHQKIYNEMREKQYIEDSRRSLNELKVSFNTKAAQSRNELLAKQNALNILELEKQIAQKKMLWAMIALFTFVVFFIVIILWRQIYARKQFTALALTDELTNAPNRRSILEFSRRQLDVALATNMPVLLAIIDLDKFKLVNDNYGHDIGDEVLKRFYRQASHTLRKVDRLGRFGGEEWLMVMPGLPLDQVDDVFQRIRAAVNSSTIERLPNNYCITFSMGVVLSGANDTVNGLLKRADNALYKAKANGRDRWVVA